MALVLVADDRQDGREFLDSVLSSSGHVVVQATNGLDALERALAVQPDLIISDIAMPGCDGYELVHRLRTGPQVCDAPVIFYSAACAPSETLTLASEWGVSRVLAKPTTPLDLLNTVESVLRESPTQSRPTFRRNFDKMHLRTLVDTLVHKLAEVEREQSRSSVLIRASRTLSAGAPTRDILGDFGAQAARVLSASEGAVALTTERNLSLDVLTPLGQFASELRVQAVKNLILELQGSPLRAGATRCAGSAAQAGFLLAAAISTRSAEYGTLYFIRSADGAPFTSAEEE